MASLFRANAGYAEKFGGLNFAVVNSYTDQTGRTINLDNIPSRIISVVPSQTELLHDLGLDKEVVGITKFCIHPEEWFRKKNRVGGTKQLNLNKIRELRPGLIIANKEENVREQIEALAVEFPVWVSDVNNLDEALQMIEEIGKMTGTSHKADAINESIRSGFGRLQPITSPLRTAYLIWKDPYMTVGGDNFIHDMMRRAGFHNVFADRSRYPEITSEELESAALDLLLLSSEPYPFKEKHAEELRLLLPGVKILTVDGEMFSWYGSRLRLAPAYFQQLGAVNSEF